MVRTKSIEHEFQLLDDGFVLSSMFFLADFLIELHNSTRFSVAQIYNCLVVQETILFSR